MILCFGSQSLSSTYLTLTYFPTPSDLWSRIESSNVFLGSHTIMTCGFRMDLGLRPEGSLTQFSVKVFLLLASCFLSLHFPVSPRQKVSRKKVEGKILDLPFFSFLSLGWVGKVPLQPLALSCESGQSPYLLWRIFNLPYQKESSIPHFCFQAHPLAGLWL